MSEETKAMLKEYNQIQNKAYSTHDEDSDFEYTEEDYQDY